MGKLARKELRKLLECIRKDKRVIIPPLLGYDSGVHLLNGKYLVVATDPCTGVPEEWFGWLLINYAASDVALSGAKPEFCTINLLGPKLTKPETFQKLMEQTCKAADELDIAIVRGHTGTYNSLSEMLGVCTVYGTVEPERLITVGNAKQGDLVLCTKPVGHETVTNFALAHPDFASCLFGAEKQKRLAKQVPMQSCVKEALQLAKIQGVHAMHDATEGGFVAALNELAEASKVGFCVDWKKLPVSREVRLLQQNFKLSDEQVLAMSSTGTVLAAVEPKVKDKVEQALRENGLVAYFLGEFTSGTKRILVKEGEEKLFPEVADDPYTRLISGK